MSAVRQAARQVGMASQDRPHNDVVLADQIARRALAVPVRPKLEVPRELYGKKPRLSLMTLIRPVCLAATALVPYIGA